MKIYIILQADYCEWSAEWGFAKPIDLRFRKSDAEKAVSMWNGENPTDQYYYSEIDFSLRTVPTITVDQANALIDVDTFNRHEQLNESLMEEKVREINDLKAEVRKLKQSVAQESTRANRAESLRAKTEQELRTVRNTIKAAKKIDRPKFLGFEDEKGKFYPTDPNNLNSIFVVGDDGNAYSLSIADLRRRGGKLTPVYEEKSEDRNEII